MIDIDTSLFGKLALAIARGGYRTTTVSRIFATSRTNASRWLQYGQRDIDRGLEDSVYARLLRTIEDAEYDLEQRVADVMENSGDWRSTAWMAERRLRETHGDVKVLQVSATQASTVDAATVSQLTRDDVRALAAAAFDLDGNGDMPGGTKGT